MAILSTAKDGFGHPVFSMVNSPDIAALYLGLFQELSFQDMNMKLDL